MKILSRFQTIVSGINEWTGRIVCILLVPLTVVVSLDVVLRYIFNRPTIWAWDVSVQILGILIILGGGYGLLHEAHIGLDVLVLRINPRKRAIIDFTTDLLLIFVVGIILWQMSFAGWHSLQIKEKYPSYLMPSIYPFKIIMVIGIFLLFIQSISKFIQDLLKLIGKTFKN